MISEKPPCCPPGSVDTLTWQCGMSTGRMAYRTRPSDDAAASKAWNSAVQAAPSGAYSTAVTGFDAAACPVSV